MDAAGPYNLYGYGLYSPAELFQRVANQDIQRIMGDTQPVAPSRRIGELSVAAATAAQPAPRANRGY